MRINNNIPAMNTHRQYSINTASVAKSTEKLSSGYRINRAGDDAAGLAISEKMRAQIRGLTMASKNSQDAISLVQTAEGALQETHNILQRMRELAVQSASDTNEQKIDRGALQAEFQQLKDEIDDISSKTRFNDQNLIDGTFQKYKMSLNSTDTTFVSDGTMSILVDRAAGGDHAVQVTVHTAKAATPVTGVAVTNATAASNDFATAITGTAGVDNLAEATAAFVGNKTDAHNGNIYTLQVSGSKASAMTFQLMDTRGNVVSEIQNVDGTTWDSDTLALNFEGVGTITITRDSDSVINDTAAGASAFTSAYNGKVLQLNTDGITQSVNPAVEGSIEIDIDGDKVTLHKGDTSANFKTAGVQLSFTAINDTDLLAASTKFSGTKITVNQTNGKTMMIQSGANQGDDLAINVSAMNTRMLGVAFSDISTRDAASKAITEVNNAVNAVSTQRAALGALQNRLGHKIANLDTSAENLQAAESRVRDLDMAKEMTTFTKNNILVQASTAMLAQANASTQGVLQLLQ